MADVLRTENGEPQCPSCKGRRFIGVEYRGTADDYDGVSEWVCEGCGARWGRWTGRELIAGDHERRYGGDRGQAVLVNRAGS